MAVLIASLTFASPLGVPGRNFPTDSNAPARRRLSVIGYRLAASSTENGKLRLATMIVAPLRKKSRIETTK